MKQTMIEILSCPNCHSFMEVGDDGRVCRCKGESRSHCFDFARSGYLNLGGSQAGDGDAKDAILARRAFLDAGYYQRLSDKVNEMICDLNVKLLLDAGCGEGYYTNRMARHCDVLGVDLSRNGIDYGARRAKQQATGAGFVVASLFEVPVANESFDAVANLFAPCAEEEFLRVLKPGGYLILVGAGERHLMGLKRAIYDNPYANPGRADLPTRMELAARQTLRYQIEVQGKDMIAALFSMTPYYWRTSIQDKKKLECLEELVTEVDFDIFLYRKGR